MPHYHLLSDNQLKMHKSIELGFYSVILHLEPAYTYKGLKTCPWHGQCKAYCLGNGGQMRFDIARNARIRRTQWLVDEPESFQTALVVDICKARRHAEALGLSLTVRLNGTSDLSWETMSFTSDGKTIFDLFPLVQFIDYSKSSDRVLFTEISNYSLTYSRSEKSTDSELQELVKARKNIAVVFDVAKGDPLPKTYKIGGKRLKVVDGDISDLRHLDPKGVVVGLRYKHAYSKQTRKRLTPKAGFIILGQ